MKQIRCGHVFIFIMLQMILCGRIHAQQVHIDLNNKSVFVQLEVSKGEIKLSAVPDTMVLVFPDENPQGTSLRFNDEKAKVDIKGKQVAAAFTVGFASTDSNAVKIHLSDIRFGKVKLVFNQNKLIGINDRLLDVPKEIVLDKNNKPVITFKSAKEPETKKPKSPWDSLETAQKVIPIESEQWETFIDLVKLKERCDCGKLYDVDAENSDKDCCPAEDSNFNDRYNLPCQQLNSDKRGHAVSQAYEIVLDRRPGAKQPVTYLKLVKDCNGEFEYYKVLKRLTPSVDKDILVRVIGHTDSLYKFVNSETLDFMDYSDQVGELFQVAEPTEESGSETADSVATDDQKISMPLVSADSMQTFLEYFEENPGLKERLSYYNDFADLSLSKNSIATLSANAALKDVFASLFEELQKLQTDLKDLKTEKEEEIKNLKQKIKEYEEQIALYINNEMSQQLANQKMALSAVLMMMQDLNVRISNHEVIELEVYHCLNTISDFLLLQLGVAMSADPAELEIRLRNSVYSPLAKNYLLDFKTIIGQIKSEYEKINARTNKYRIYTCQVSTPNADALGIELQSKTGKTEFNNSYRTKLGFKIDFSSGLIYSGLSNPEYELVSQTIRFKETKDSVASDGTILTTFTGNVIDSTGQVIRSHDSGKFNAGFLLHAYTRSGRAANLALTTGTVISESNIQLMLGGSLLLAARGEYRIALSAGCIWGKQRSLNGELSKYQWSADQGGLFSSIHEVKPFYQGDGNVNAGVVEKYGNSYFFAITMNFGSISVK